MESNQGPSAYPLTPYRWAKLAYMCVYVCMYTGVYTVALLTPVPDQMPPCFLEHLLLVGFLCLGLIWLRIFMSSSVAQQREVAGEVRSPQFSVVSVTFQFGSMATQLACCWLSFLILCLGSRIVNIIVTIVRKRILPNTACFIMCLHFISFDSFAV